MGQYESGSGASADYDAHILQEHIHSVQRVYPTLANAVTITGAVGAWTLGVYAQVVPVNTITEPFDIHFINVSNASAADNYQIELYSGSTGAEVLIAQTKMVRPIGVTQSIAQPVITPIQPANTRISARVASASGGSDTVDITLFYHTY